MTQAYGHGYESQYIVLTCCTAVQTRSVLNVALSSPCTTAIECFLGCLGQVILLPVGLQATMGQVCFTAISSNRACPTVFIALSSV